MNRRLVVPGAALVVVLATGCAPEAGEVADRDYSPAWISTTTQCTTAGQVRTCTPQVIHYPESWSLRLDDGEDEGWRDVAPSDYEVCHVGDVYPGCAREGARR